MVEAEVKPRQAENEPRKAENDHPELRRLQQAYDGQERAVATAEKRRELIKKLEREVGE